MSSALIVRWSVLILIWWSWKNLRDRHKSDEEYTYANGVFVIEAHEDRW